MPNWNFDAKDYIPDGHFTPIPPGDYRVRIEDAEETRSKAGNEMFKLTLSVSGKKNRLWFYIVFPQAVDERFAEKKVMTNQKLGEVWESFGLKVGDMNVLNWRGKVGAARVKQEMNKDRGELQNAVSYFLTRRRQEGLAPWSEPEGSGAGAPVSGGDSMSMRAESGGDVDLPF